MGHLPLTCFMSRLGQIALYISLIRPFGGAIVISLILLSPSYFLLQEKQNQHFVVI
jgi:hypothetical protein